MKKILCDVCNKVLEIDSNKVEFHYTVKVISPFCDIKSYKAHICENCYDKLETLLNRGGNNGK